MSTLFILGSGAIGSLFASALQASGADICLIARDKQHADLLNKKGINVDGNTVHVVSRTIDNISLIEQLLVCTKAYDTLAALENIAVKLCPRARILLLQNGMGQHHEVHNRFPDASVFAGLCTEGVTRLAHHKIVRAGIGKTIFGHVLGPVSDLPKALLHCHLKVEISHQIHQAQWQKLAINGAINGLTVQNNCPNGELIHDATIYQSMQRLCEEIELVANIEGIFFNKPLHELAKDVCLATAANISSMLQDVRANRQTEADYIYGYLQRCADRHDLNVPLINQLYTTLL